MPACMPQEELSGAHPFKLAQLHVPTDIFIKVAHAIDVRREPLPVSIVWGSD